MDTNDEAFQAWLLEQDGEYLELLYQAYQHQQALGRAADSVSITLHYPTVPAITEREISKLRTHLDRYGLSKLHE